jgi:hypothetical protein
MALRVLAVVCAAAAAAPVSAPASAAAEAALGSEAEVVAAPGDWPRDPFAFDPACCQANSCSACHGLSLGNHRVEVEVGAAAAGRRAVVARVEWRRRLSPRIDFANVIGAWVPGSGPAAGIAAAAATAVATAAEKLTDCTYAAHGWNGQTMHAAPHAPTRALCCAACRRTPPCAAAVLDPAGQCYLKTALAGPTGCSNCTSCVPLAAPPARPPPSALLLANLTVVNATAASALIAFEPSFGAGIYAFYYLPYNFSGGSGSYAAVFGADPPPTVCPAASPPPDGVRTSWRPWPNVSAELESPVRRASGQVWPANAAWKVADGDRRFEMLPSASACSARPAGAPPASGVSCQGWDGLQGWPEFVTFDLGGCRTVDGFALWVRARLYAINLYNSHHI